MKICLIILYTLLPLALSTNGIDLSTLTSTENFKCLAQTHNVTFIVMRGYRSYGAVDPNVKTVLKAAQDAGIKQTDTYMFPCRNKSAVDQANELIDYLGAATYGTIWIDVETNNSPGCSWASFSSASNCQFLEDLTAQIVKRGKQVGIYASIHMWNTILGSSTACEKFTHFPLWYAHYDGVKAFSDFSPFGGWTKPTYKQYNGTTTLCNTGVDLNWSP